MRFYRSLSPIVAMTFDLDDTLYDNQEVILRSEQAWLDFLRQHFAPLRHYQPTDWQKVRIALSAQHPDIIHDVTVWRWQSIYQVLCQQGLTQEQAKSGANIALDNFLHWRNQITIPSITHKTLQMLAQKIPLAAITNGNADPQILGLSSYFIFVLRAGPDGRAKPYPDMYHQAQQRLQLPMSQILHIGDDLKMDVSGALACGMQTCWFNQCQHNLVQVGEGRHLPHIEISQLDSLIALL